MSVYLGNIEIGQMFLDNTEISEAYIGSTKVFDAGIPPEPPTPVLPEGYTQLEYIENISNAYINTGCVLDLTETIECEVSITDYSQYAFVFGNFLNDNANCTNLILPSTPDDDLFVHYNTKSYGGANRVGKADYFKKLNISLTPTYCYVNGVKYDFTNFTEGTEYNGEIYIFASPSGYGNSKARIYHFSISGKRNMIPCISPNNVVGMYDTIGNYFYSSPNNVPFVAGPVVRNIPYQKVEYLQSDSEAYINTGISGGNDNIGVYGTFLYSTFVNYAAIFSNYVSETSNSTRLILSSRDNYCYGSVNTKTSRDNAGFARNKQIKFSVAKNRIVAYYDDSFNGAALNQSAGTSNNNNILLFRAAEVATHRDTGLKIYGITIRDNTRVLRDFVPVRVGNVGYMFDKVSGELFGNLGTSEFVIGPDIN